MGHLQHLARECAGLIAWGSPHFPGVADEHALGPGADAYLQVERCFVSSRTWAPNIVSLVDTPYDPVHSTIRADLEPFENDCFGSFTDLQGKRGPTQMRCLLPARNEHAEMRKGNPWSEAGDRRYSGPVGLQTDESVFRNVTKHCRREVAAPWRRLKDGCHVYSGSQHVGACIFTGGSMRFNPSLFNSASTGLSLFAAALCFSMSAAAADEVIHIPKVVPFAENTNVPAAVRDECELGEKVSAFLTESAPNVKVSAGPEQTRYLSMAITEVYAAGGGAWSGPKWMTVTGTLKENDQAVASFRAKRFSTGGAFGGFKGTCSIIGRCTKAIAQDIAEWLKNPVDGAELGDAR